MKKLEAHLKKIMYGGTMDRLMGHGLLEPTIGTTNVSNRRVLSNAILHIPTIHTRRDKHRLKFTFNAYLQVHKMFLILN